MRDSKSMLELSRRQITLSVCFSTNITTLPAKAMWHQGKRASLSIFASKVLGNSQPISEYCSVTKVPWKKSTAKWSATIVCVVIINEEVETPGRTSPKSYL